MMYMYTDTYSNIARILPMQYSRLFYGKLMLFPLYVIYVIFVLKFWNTVVVDVDKQGHPAGNHVDFRCMRPLLRRE